MKWLFCLFPVIIYLFKFSNGNTRTISEICSITTLERQQWCYSGVVIVNFQQIPYIVLVFFCYLSASKCWLGEDWVALLFLYKFEQVLAYLVFCIKVLFLNIFHTTGPFLYPLKIPEKLCFSDIFRGCRTRLVARNGWMLSPTDCHHVFAERSLRFKFFEVHCLTQN